jgi:hypothetical protein
LNTFNYRLILHYWKSRTTLPTFQNTSTTVEVKEQQYSMDVRTQCCSKCGTKAVRGNSSSLPSLTGVRGHPAAPFDRIQKVTSNRGQFVVELEKGLISSLTLGLLHLIRSDHQAAATMMASQVMEIPSVAPMMMDTRARRSRLIRD